MRRKAFSALRVFQCVFVSESKVWVCCSSATFYGKVSFPPLCPQRLPDTDRACRLCVCVENRRCWFQRAAQEEAEFRSCWSLHGEGRQAPPDLRRVSDCLLCSGFLFPSCGCGVLTFSAFDLDCGGSRRGIASGASGSGELHVMGCVFSLPEDRRDAAERSVKVCDLLLL